MYASISLHVGNEEVMVVGEGAAGAIGAMDGEAGGAPGVAGRPHAAITASGIARRIGTWDRVDGCYG